MSQEGLWLPESTTNHHTLVVQAHHDHCDHETLTRDEEELVHTWESSCVRCSIQRKYNQALQT